MTSQKNIAIVGGGLVGSLLSIYLAKRGYRVSVFERRTDPRHSSGDEGRSINLALSTRGIRALEEAGLAESVKGMAIPMHGRMMHDVQGTLTFQPYGKEGQYINSISRGALNRLLIETAEKFGVSFLFEHRCVDVNIDNTTVTLNRGNRFICESFDIVAGADGAFSAVRGTLQVTDRFDYSQQYLGHGYKELHMPPSTDGRFALEKNALHIWPRESFMMIALPNPDCSFTCTLFLPFDGQYSFASLHSSPQVADFFDRMFIDAVPSMPHLTKDFSMHPTGSLVTIKCFPWVRNNIFLIGDAAHAIVPFYGQGMNAGFEDCRILNDLLDQYSDDWQQALPAFQETRKTDCDAIATLAFDNFIEMRDRVADPEFLLRKKIEARLHERFPDKWIPLYAMVTFHDNIRYSQALRIGRRQEKIMNEVMRMPDIASHWHELDLGRLVQQLDQLAI